MADNKKSDIFGGKQSAAQDKADAQDRRDAAAHDRAEARQDQQDKVHAVEAKGALTFTANKDRVYTRTYPSGKVPVGTWGLGVWTRDANPIEYPCFLDNQGDWWWATTTAQNGVNPAVEKTEEPVGWRGF